MQSRRFIWVWGLLNAAWLPGCSVIPLTVEEGIVEVSEVRKAIECELATVATDPDLKPYKVTDWRVKSALDLTLVTRIGADGRAVWSIPHSPSPVKLTPSFGLSRRNHRNAHLDFTTSMSAAAAKLEECARFPRISEAGFGLASWFKSTLMSVEKGRHAGMSYTTEFQVVATPATRLGYSFVRLDVDVGANGSWDSTHRLTVAIAPPAGDPVPIPVYQVPSPVTAERLTTARPKAIPRPAVRDDPTLNRLLDQQAPVRLEPR